jgi:hypothetical protein
MTLMCARLMCARGGAYCGRRTVEVSRLKAFKGSSFRYEKWSAMTVNFEKDQPWLIIPKESLKLNLRSYDLTEWEDVGDNPDWGLDKVLDEDWESPSKGAHCIRLNWNGLAWQPAHQEMTILFRSKEERDEILSFMKRHVIAWCKFAKFPDGSERVYLDSMGKGFQEHEPEWVDPPPPTPREVDRPQIASETPQDDRPQAASETPQESSQEPKEMDAQVQEEADRKPVERKPYKAPVPRDFGLKFQVWSPIFKKWIPQEGILYCLEVKEACQSNGRWTEDIKVPEHFGALELWEQGSITSMRARYDNIIDRVKPHAESIRDRIVNYYRWEGQELALIADQHGFSKQLVDYYSRQCVWDYVEEGAYEKWNAIMKDAIEVSEQALAQQGLGFRDADKPKTGEGDEDFEKEGAEQNKNEGDEQNNSSQAAAQGSKNNAPTLGQASTDASAGAVAATNELAQDASSQPTEAEGPGDDGDEAKEKVSTDIKQKGIQDSRTEKDEKQDSRTESDASARISGGHFGADTDEAKRGTGQVISEPTMANLPSDGEPGKPQITICFLLSFGETDSKCTNKLQVEKVQNLSVAMCLSSSKQPRRTKSTMTMMSTTWMTSRT